MSSTCSSVSVEIFEQAVRFSDMGPDTAFVKWAAVAVSSTEHVPSGMEVLQIPAGTYACFTLKGRHVEVMEQIQHLYAQLLPSTEYVPDHRPQFAIMGEHYKLNDPASEEEFYVPVIKK